MCLVKIVKTKTAFQRLVHLIGGSEACHVYHLVIIRYVYQIYSKIQLDL